MHTDKYSLAVHKKDDYEDSKRLVKYITRALMLQRMLWYYCGCVAAAFISMTNMNLTMKIVTLGVSGIAFAYASIRNELDDIRH